MSIAPCDTLKHLADPTRLRLIHLLIKEELSVAELQDILNMGQSRISTHLAILKQGHLVQVRKEGKQMIYSALFEPQAPTTPLIEAICAASQDDPTIKEDHANLLRILEKRRRASDRYFNTIAERLGKNYCPGRSWEAIGHLLLQLTPHVSFADLGSGEGILGQLLAKGAKHVYCIDRSKKMVQIGTEMAQKNELNNLTFIMGDIQQVPLADESVEVALLSQALHHADNPQTAIDEAFRILKPKGKLLILDLKEHKYTLARKMFADRWLGFSESTLYQMLKQTGFKQIEIHNVYREEKKPYFETLLAAGTKLPQSSLHATYQSKTPLGA